MNLWVLFLCRFLLHSKVKGSRILSFSLLATLGEVGILCIPVGDSNIKIVIGFGGITAGVIYLLFRPKTRDFFGKLLIFFYIAASLLGGAFIVLEMLFEDAFVSFWGLSLGMVFLTEIIKKVQRKFFVKKEFSEVELTLSGNRKCTVTALVDSGNGLIEPISKKPVSLVEKGIIKEFENELLKENFRVVPFHSVGKEKGLLEAYFIERLEIKKEGEKVVVDRPIIAFTSNNISVNRKYQMILHPALLESEYSIG